jgi:hypothetical protein
VESVFLGGLLLYGNVGIMSQVEFIVAWASSSFLSFALFCVEFAPQITEK